MLEEEDHELEEDDHLFEEEDNLLEGDGVLEKEDCALEEQVSQVTDQRQYTAMESNKSGDSEKGNAEKTTDKPKRKRKLLKNKVRICISNSNITCSL